MTAPGNDALLITLLAAFTACLGYAAGRLHQWYRTVPDRDAAYRDGYDTATRSVFSLAARLIGPKRAARGTAVVSTTPGTTSRSDTSAVLLPASSSVAPPPADLRPSTLAASSVPAPPLPTSGPPPPSGTLSAPASSSRSNASPVPTAIPATHPPSSATAPAGAPLRSRRSPVSFPSASSSSPAPAGEAEAAGGGRHFVPDELVQAPTYRLTPDRVARAKVREAIPDDGDCEETTRLPSVPRPRTS